jgi:hypothetical protein
MRIGYARISTQEQNLELQTDALKAADCERIFTEKASGAQRDRPELTAALGHLRAGDALVVWKLDRLARSLKQLIETVEALAQLGHRFRVADRSNRYVQHRRPVGVPDFRSTGRVRAGNNPGKNLGRPFGGEGSRSSRWKASSPQTG